jgi:hypothetical protein
MGIIFGGQKIFAPVIVINHLRCIYFIKRRWIEAARGIAAPAIQRMTTNRGVMEFFDLSKAGRLSFGRPGALRFRTKRRRRTAA